jgi:hypothetical protein
MDFLATLLLVIGLVIISLVLGFYFHNEIIQTILISIAGALIGAVLCLIVVIIFLWLFDL